MSASGGGRVSFKPDTNEKTTTTTTTTSHSHNHNSSSNRASGDKTRFAASCRFRLPRSSELSPVRFLKHIGDKVAAALQFVSRRRSRRRRRRSSPNVSSSGRSNPSIAPLDSRRAEAISDCIEFINSSSSLQRSNSVPTNPPPS